VSGRRRLGGHGAGSPAFGLDMKLGYTVVSKCSMRLFGSIFAREHIAVGSQALFWMPTSPDSMRTARRWEQASTALTLISWANVVGVNMSFTPGWDHQPVHRVGPAGGSLGHDFVPVALSVISPSNRGIGRQQEPMACEQQRRKENTAKPTTIHGRLHQSVSWPGVRQPPERSYHPTDRPNWGQFARCRHHLRK